MEKKLFVFFILHLALNTGVSLYGQISPPPVIWGNVPKDQREMKEYVYDTQTSAVIVCDFGIWYPVDMPAGIVRLQRHVRLKILREEGISQSEISLIYNKSEGENITDLKAQTINFDGNRKKTTPLALKFLPEKTLKNGLAEKSFVFREVSPGSIIEYSYSLKTKSVEHLKPWYFQSEIPTIHSEIQLVGFEPYQFDAVSQRLELPSSEENRWIMRHIAGLKKQPFISRWDDYRIGIHFQLQDLMTIRDEQEEWRLITLDLQQASIVSDDSASQSAIYALAQSLTRNAVTEEEKIAEIHAHVRDHVRWNGISDIWVNQSAAGLYRSRVGNSAEINMLMAHLLWNAGITAYRGFVSTRDHGKPKQFPLRNQFNDLFILAVGDGQSFILDATEKDLPYDLPPYRMLNEMAWIIRDTTAGWSKIPDRFYKETIIMGQLEMDSTGKISGEIEEIYKGYAAQDFGRKNREKPEIKIQETPGKTLSVHHPFSLEKEVHVEDKMLIVNLLSKYHDADYPFETESRVYPLDFGYLIRERYILNLRIPNNYQVIRMPVSARISMEGREMFFEYLCENRSGVIQIRTTFEISKSIIYPESFSAVKDFYGKMLSRIEEEIVLIRKE
ncbi:MAG: DUF3857 and transglutaminase domain-containing protein [Bacteroidia bacterium]|nr:DUF3857 and transglutaminase domain-containing protein [Bacteroidia bacterium]